MFDADQLALLDAERIHRAAGDVRLAHAMLERAALTLRRLPSGRLAAGVLRKELPEEIERLITDADVIADELEDYRP